MSSDIIVNKEIVEYINNNSTKLHPVQKEIISYNEQLGRYKKNANFNIAMSFFTFTN